MRLALLVNVMVAVCAHAMAAPFSLHFPVDLSGEAARYHDLLGTFAIEMRVASDLHFPESGDVITTSLVSPRLVIGPDFPGAPIEGLPTPHPAEILTVLAGLVLVACGTWRHKSRRNMDRVRRGRSRTERRSMA